jgi:hypothetical protein
MNHRPVDCDPRLDHTTCDECGRTIEPDGPDYDGSQAWVDTDGHWDCEHAEEEG